MACLSLKKCDLGSRRIRREYHCARCLDGRVLRRSVLRRMRNTSWDALNLLVMAALAVSCSKIVPSARPTAPHHRLNVEEWRVAQALCDVYVPDVQAGNTVALGGARVPFAIYIASMHEHLHYAYEEELAAAREAYPALRGATDLAVRVEIVINQADGSLAKLGVVKSSGSVVFDVVALAALRRAVPFDAPPPSLASPGGKVYVHWIFHADPFEACAPRNAVPFVLAHEPSSKIATAYCMGRLSSLDVDPRVCTPAVRWQNPRETPNCKAKALSLNP